MNSTEQPTHDWRTLRHALRELVGGNPDQPYLQMARSLPRFVDDAERDFGGEIYSRMLRDPVLASAIDTLKIRTLDDGVAVAPAEPNNPLSVEIADFVRRNLALLSTPIEETAFELLDALAYGHRIAEKVFTLGRSGPDKGRLLLKALKVKPRGAYRFVTDAYSNVIGLAVIEPGKTGYLPSGVVPDPKALPNLVPPDKFLILTVGQRHNDPRGASWLRPAYNAWWLKQQTWPLLLKYLAQFAGPSIIGYTPEDVATVVDQDTQRTPEDVLLAALKGFQSGSVAALRGGSKVDVLQSAGDGQAFLSAIDLYNREMTHAILRQTRATMEAQHGSKADSETAQDLLDSIVFWLRGMLGRTLERQLCGPLTFYNFGPDTMALAPKITLSAVSKPDFADIATAVAALQTSGYLEHSQRAQLDAIIGLPQRAATPRRQD